MKVIHIYGASGSGTTTLGLALCEKYGYKHMDTDDYFWLSTDPPFTNNRILTERIALMEHDIKQYENVVISGSLSGWGDVLIPYFDLAIRVITPAEVRLQRLREREFKRFGSRILEHGDMYEENRKFLKWAEEYDIGDINMRSKIMHDRWSELLACDKIIVDGTKPVQENLKILKHYLEEW